MRSNSFQLDQGLESVAALLGTVEWRLFCTLTFRPKDERLGLRARRRMFFKWLRYYKVYAEFKLPCIWALRSEVGEMGGLHHYHALLKHKNGRAASPALCFALMDAWEKIGGGFSRIHKFDVQLDGLGYLLKLAPGQEYEFLKTTVADIEVSDVLMKSAVERSRSVGRLMSRDTTLSQC